MGLLDAQSLTALRADAPEAREKAAQALEAVLLKQVLMASGTFKGTQTAGSGLHAELFAEAVAEAVAARGGLGLAQALTSQLPAAAPTPFGPALSGEAEVSSTYGVRPDPIHGESALHRGVDLAAAEGTAILAARDGVVVSAGPRGGYGQAVELDHGDGVHTLYAHASMVHVRPGERVAQGQPIAQVGQTGRATGPHLHLELRLHGTPVDPRRILKAYGRRADDPGEEPPPPGLQGAVP